MKNNKGITLIALVVTIIVLLILAGVSIAMLTGQNGILNRASKSSMANTIGEAKDAIALEVSNAVSDYYSVKYTSANDVTDLNKTDVENEPGNTTAALATIIKNRVKGLDSSYPDVTIDATESEISITSKKDAGVKSTAELDSNGKIGKWKDVGF